MSAYNYYIQKEIEKSVKLPPTSLTNLSHLILNNYVVVDDGNEIKDIKKVSLVQTESGDWQVKIII